MPTHTSRELYDAKGPFDTALVDVSHDSENRAQAHELRVRAAADELTQLGAPDAVVEEITSHVRAGHHLVLLAGDPQSVALAREGLEG